MSTPLPAFPAAMAGTCTQCQLRIIPGDLILRGQGRYDYRHQNCPTVPQTEPVDARWLFGAKRHDELVRAIEILDALHADYRAIGDGHCKSYEGMVSLTLLDDSGQVPAKDAKKVHLGSYLYADHGRSQDFRDATALRAWLQDGYAQNRQENVDLSKLGIDTWGPEAANPKSERIMSLIERTSTLPARHQDIPATGLALLDPVTAGQLAQIGQMVRDEVELDAADPEAETKGNSLVLHLGCSWDRLDRSKQPAQSLCHRNDLRVETGKLRGPVADVLARMAQ